jgi:hypothetical protein
VITCEYGTSFASQYAEELGRESTEMHPDIPNTTQHHTTAPFLTKAGFIVMISSPTLLPPLSQGLVVLPKAGRETINLVSPGAYRNLLLFR